MASKCFITCEQAHFAISGKIFGSGNATAARRMDRGKLNGTFIDIILTRLVDLKCHTDQAMTSIQNGRQRSSIYRKLTFQVQKLGKNKAYVTLENDHLMKHFKLLIRFMSFLLLLF